MRPQLTYANVTSTLALFLALAGGTAYAVTLAKNSVKSKHIAKGAVASSDLRTNAVSSPKVKDDSLTGADVAEGSLAKVPAAASADTATKAASADTAAKATTADSATKATSADTATKATSADTATTATTADSATTAATATTAGSAASAALADNATLLGGHGATAFSRVARSAGDFTEALPLQLTVDGYGRFILSCDNGTQEVANDDLVSFEYQNLMVDSAIVTGSRTSATASNVDGTVRVIARDDLGSTGTAMGGVFADRIHVVVTMMRHNANRGITFIAGGHDDETSTTTCNGSIQAFTSG